MTNITKTKFLAYREFDNHTLIIDSRTNKQVHRLNEVGSFLWFSLDSHPNESELISSLQEEYDVGIEDATKDVSEFLSTLKIKGLINE